MGAPAAVATPSVDAANAIDAKYTSFGGAGSLLGTPIAAAVDVGAGAERDYSGGVIYYSKDSGAKVMYGAILDRYKALGGPMGDLGFPTNDESDAGNGVARFNDFTAPGGASIYWSPRMGRHGGQRSGTGRMAGQRRRQRPLRLSHYGYHDDSATPDRQVRRPRPEPRSSGPMLADWSPSPPDSPHRCPDSVPPRRA